jgi:hypothetical protein
MEQTDPVTGTHFLRAHQGGVSRGTETNRTNGGYSLPGERIRKDKSVHVNKQSERRVHTNLRSQREARVTTRKQTEKRGALTDWRVEKEVQVRIRKQIDRARNSQTGDRRGWDKSGHRNKSTERGEVGELTPWRAQREEQVRTRKQTEGARDTHYLESEYRDMSLDTQKNRANERHSLPRERRERQVRTELNRASGTHSLESTEGGLSQDAVTT